MHVHTYKRTPMFTYFSKRGSLIRGLLSPANERGMAILSMKERSRLENVYMLYMLKLYQEWIQFNQLNPYLDTEKDIFWVTK